MGFDGGFMLRNDSLSVLEAAQTVSLAFSNDPLIRWLRPHASPWGNLDPSSMKWQCRRLRRAIHEDMVLSLTHASDRRSKDQKLEREQQLGNFSEPRTWFGAIAVLQPPHQIPRSKLAWVWSWLQLRFLDFVDPIEDKGADVTRVEIMMEQHEKGLAQLKRQLLPQEPWYVEIIAVRPSFHGQGLGSKLLRHIIDMTGGDPIVLECTDRNTVDFYKKFGFEVVKEVELESEKPREVVSIFLMLRR